MLLTAQRQPIITVKPVSLVLPHKDGMELNVLTDAPMEEFGMFHLRHASAQLDNSGMDSLA